jgi:tetratricopeptide (TPR) repeat protein
MACKGVTSERGGIDLNNQGCLAHKAGDYALAESLFNKAAELLKGHSDIKRAQALCCRAASLLELGRVQEAEDDARECVRLNPAWTKSYVRLGAALERGGKHREACNVYVDAIKRDEMKHLETLRPALVEANKVARVLSEAFIKSLQMRDKEFCECCQTVQKPLRLCSRCRAVHYCGVEHQRQHHAEHKKHCRKLEERSQDQQDLQNWEQQSKSSSQQVVETCRPKGALSVAIDYCPYRWSPTSVWTKHWWVKLLVGQSSTPYYSDQTRCRSGTPVPGFG